MPLKQFRNTLLQIIENKHVNKPKALAKHLVWQIRKMLDLFPFEIRVSDSLIIVEDKNCGGCALANCLGMYDYNIMNLIKLLSEKENYFFDIGANVGLYSLLASEAENINVYSFEPHPKTFSQLFKNIEINGRKNITPLKLALSDKAEKSGFSDFAESSLNHFVEDAFIPQIVVDTKRGDEVCNELKIIPSFIKIDVEGFELKVLSGLGEYLSQIKFVIIEFGELNKKDEPDIVQLFKEKNFEGPFYFDFDGKFFTKIQIKSEKNVVFIQRNIRKYLIENYGLTIV